MKRIYNVLSKCILTIVQFWVVIDLVWIFRILINDGKINGNNGNVLYFQFIVLVLIFFILINMESLIKKIFKLFDK
ncbi:Uncharacterised protein [Sebaldella termitidis]|jgi:hypothetical protein|uniref:Uncharacterized protein n=1 Tax=Sebaldella termitidis (strain ATCC 33386 / NCTC 11300) TaxID=526218 RepID=D1AG24_SEBTE|nr:hypothetical protein [Sebaldella termitidis]ACZ10650.1 hypothetical protein Sterm_3816 [Sebaldella termitidis ATCC 33386]MBP7979472.1 hypothetical protein [Sebaldella sp.]SUI25991.1 Uncharacterised protein [Sebaldella termitidis]